MSNQNNHTNQNGNGHLPEGWEVKTLGEIGDFSKGKGILKEQILSEGIPCIRYGELYTTFDYTIKKCFSYINEQTAKESQEIKYGDILFAGSGETIEEIGKSAVYLGIEKAYAGGDVIILSSNGKTFPECLTYVLETDYVRKQKRKLGQGNSIVHIYPNNLSKLKLPLPPLPEQKAIAACLSTWDKALELLKKKIEKAELRKKWLMQQLLTGKLRLRSASGKRFNEEWKEYHLKDIAEEVSIKNKKKSDLIVLSCTKYDGLVPSLEYFGRKIYSNDLSPYKIVPKNHFAYATNHIEEGSIGYQVNYDEALISPMYTVFKTDTSINDDFFFKVLKSHQLIYQYNVRMEGSIDRRGGLRWDAFSIIKVRIPSVTEQTAIAKVLQSADNEIQLLNKKLDKIKNQKKGLMQVLLTGKKRLRY